MLWFIGYDYEDHLTNMKLRLLQINVLSSGKWTLYQVKKLYTSDIQRLNRVISSVDSFSQFRREFSSFVGRMTTLKDEFSSILSKSTDAKTSPSKTDQVFIMLTFLKLRPKFGNIKDKCSLDKLFSMFSNTKA